MRHASKLVPALFALVAGALVACGGATESLDFDNNDPGGDGPGGVDAGDDGSIIEEDAGFDADLDAGDSPDAPGSEDGGEEPLPDCPGPIDPAKAALCLALDPEEIAFIANDEKLDGDGILYVAIYDKANPSNSDVPLAMHIEPPQPATGYATKSLAELTATPYRFDGFPDTVYARVFFVDDVEGTTPESIVPGTWVGGIDLSNGFVEDAPIEPIALDQGKGTTVKMPLSALRKLTVEVSRSADPASGGDAQGPLTVIALDSQAIELNQSPKIFGLGELACADVSGSNEATVEGVVIGKGPYWLTGVLNDFGGTDDVPPGSFVSAKFGWPLQAPDENELSYPADAYTVKHSITLNLVVPGQTGTDNVSCP